MAGPNTRESETITIRFEGGLADENRVPLVEFIESLQGWQDYLRLTSNVWGLGRLTLNKPRKEFRTSYEVRAVKPGSVEVDLIGFLSWAGNHAANGLIGAGSVLTVQQLWKWRKAVFSHQVQSHLAEETIEEAAAGLSHLARQNGLDVDRNEDTTEIVEKLDDSMKRSMRPITTSVERTTIVNRTTNVFITATKREKAAVVNAYAAISQPEQVDGVEEREIILREISLDKRSASFHFAEPRDDEERGLKRGRILDGRITRPKDPYTGSLYERGSIRLNIQKKVINSKTGAVRWELGVEKPPNQNVIFPSG